MASKERKFRILITAGPTREYIDPVRYISNDSSGRMGFALARAAEKLGMSVTLVAGPVEITTPDNVRRIDVITALEMSEAVMKHASHCDAVIMAAAVADYRPEKPRRSKIKKKESGRGKLAIRLKENPDILAMLCRRRQPHQTIVGFALETEELEKNARGKLEKKGCDWIIANPARTIGKNSGRAILISREGRRISLPLLSKEELAVVILSHVLS